MTSSEQALVDIEAASPDSMPSEDGVVSVIRRLRMDVEDLQGLIMDEGIVLVPRTEVNRMWERELPSFANLRKKALLHHGQHDWVLTSL